MSVAKQIAAQLAQAKAKLATAQQRAQAGVQILDRVQRTVDGALGGTGHIGLVSSVINGCRKRMLAEMLAIKPLIADIDQAIATLNKSAAAGAAGGASGGA